MMQNSQMLLQYRRHGDAVVVFLVDKQCWSRQYWKWKALTGDRKNTATRRIADRGTKGVDSHLHL